MRKGLNYYFLLPVAAFALVVSILAINIPYGHEFAKLNAWRVAPWNDIGIIATKLGEEFAWAFAIIALFFINRRDASVLLLSALLLMPLVFGLKELYLFYRPSTFLNMHQLAASVVYVPEVKLHTGRTSFPSGHTFSAFALYFILSQLLLNRPKYKAVGLLFAFLGMITALSRIFLVQHFLVDVLAGITFGLLYGWLVLEVSDTMKAKANK